MGPGPLWAAVMLGRWAEEERNRPRLCGRCGGLGQRRSILLLTGRECRACHGSGGAVDDERAWWGAGR
jgi:DnaJ-class molecular chaperone